MSSTTTMVATDFRIQEWAGQIRECRNRPSGMKVSEWCDQHGITKSNYYYRLRKVREACLASFPPDAIPPVAQAVVPVPSAVMQPLDTEPQAEASGCGSLDIIIGSIRIHVDQRAPMDLLASVLGVAANVK